MDFSILRIHFVFVASSITEKTLCTVLCVILSVSHNKEELLTIREQLCSLGYYLGWGGSYVSLIVVLFALFYYHSLVLCPMSSVSLDIFDRYFGFLLRRSFTFDTANKMSLFNMKFNKKTQ